MLAIFWGQYRAQVGGRIRLPIMEMPFFAVLAHACKLTCQYPSLGQAVEIRRVHIGAAEDTDVCVTEITSHDGQNVRTIIGLADIRDCLSRGRIVPYAVGQDQRFECAARRETWSFVDHTTRPGLMIPSGSSNSFSERIKLISASLRQ